MTTTTIRSPFDGTEVGEVPEHQPADVDQAVEAARSAAFIHPLPAWRRAEILTLASDMIGARREELAQTITRESSKPISAARTEVARALSTIGFAGLEARKVGGDVLPMEGSMIAEGKLAYTFRVPKGVVGAIAPFNFPLNLVAHKVGPALAAGCPVVLKPSEQTPFSSFALADILRECGLPEGWLNVVTGAGETVGNAIVEHRDIAHISFTGSADVGWSIARKAAPKSFGLELGNSTPVIIEPDSDWQRAAHAVATGGYANAGQSCISVQRVYVQESIAGPFTELLASIVEGLAYGDPWDEQTISSAMISEAATRKAHAWVEEAADQGAEVVVGGNVEGTVMQPTLLAHTTLEMRVQQEEMFAPVVSLQPYDTLREAIDLANGTRYGLQAGVFTNRINDALQATRELQFGAVIVNEVPTWRADTMPYGGVKDSGNTREGPAYAVESMTELRLAVIDNG